MAHDSPISDCISVTHNGMMHAFDTPEMRVCGRVIRSCKELKGGKISVPHRLPRLPASEAVDGTVCLAQGRQQLSGPPLESGGGAKRKWARASYVPGCVSARPVAVSEYAAADTCPSRLQVGQDRAAMRTRCCCLFRIRMHRRE